MLRTDEGSVPNEEVLLKGRLPRVGKNKLLLLLSETQVKERENSKPTVLSVTFLLCTLCGQKKRVMKSELFDASCACSERKKREQRLSSVHTVHKSFGCSYTVNSLIRAGLNYPYLCN